MCVCVLVIKSCLTLCNPIDCSPKAPLSMEFSRQGYWSGLPLPAPKDLPDPGAEPWSPTFQQDSLQSKLPGKPNEAKQMLTVTNDKIILRFKNKYFIWKAKIARVDNKNSTIYCLWASQAVLVVKKPPAKARDVRDTGSILGSGRSSAGILRVPLIK